MGIVIAAAITTLVALGVAWALWRRVGDDALRRALLVAGLVVLPLSPLTYYLVRIPLDALLSRILGPGGTIVPTFYAPLTEEPAKWLVLLVPLVGRALTPKSAVPLALATGLGFGIGEIWMLAEQIAGLEAYADVPFYLFGGFFYERLLVVFLHGAFVMFAFSRLASGRSFLVGGLIGMALHWLLNIPIFLTATGAFGIPVEKWQLITVLVQIVMVWGLAVAAARLRRASAGDKSGRA
jgi:hypothetical protein